MKMDIGGMVLHYDVHGEGEPLLWLHGGFGVGADWRPVFGEPPAGFQLIAPDLRGHGRSTGAQASYSFAQTADDMFALLDARGLTHIEIIGLSGGGITALHMATTRPAQITRMVIVSAPAAFPDQAKAIQRGLTLEGLGAQLADMRVRHPRDGQLEALVAQMRALPAGRDPDFSRETLARITADTLIVFGDRDFLYPVSVAVDLRAAIPNSWLWVVPNGGHGPIFGAQAADFARVSLAFLAGGFRR